MPSIIDFLEARLAEDEAAALAATEGPWGVEEDGEVYKSDSVREVPCTRLDGSKYISTDHVNVTCDSEGMRASVQIENATHIARHDPARVLREVVAKRRVLARYEEAKHEARNPVSAANRQAARVAEGELEDVLRDLAAVYSDHPDYYPEWITS